MFKQRIKIVFKKIGYWVGMFMLCIFILGGLMAFFLYVPHMKNVPEYLLIGVFGLMFLVLILVVLLKIAHFIHWLFIEPYRTAKQRKEKSQ